MSSGVFYISRNLVSTQVLDYFFFLHFSPKHSVCVFHSFLTPWAEESLIQRTNHFYLIISAQITTTISAICQLAKLAFFF